MDVFRVGTLLELCRDIAESLALDGRGVKVCVQQAMGQGVFQVLLTIIAFSCLKQELILLEALTDKLVFSAIQQFHDI